MIHMKTFKCTISVKLSNLKRPQLTNLSIHNLDQKVCTPLRGVYSIGGGISVILHIKEPGQIIVSSYIKCYNKPAK